MQTVVYPIKQVQLQTNILTKPKPMDDDNSQMFQVDNSKEVQARPMPFFNQNTKIIQEGQRHRVVFGEMELEKKPMHEIVAPYLYKFAATTAELATQAGSYTFQALKNGFLWVYNKFVDEVIPYAVENLPKIVFVIKKKEEISHVNSTSFEVIGVEEKEYESIYQKESNDKEKKRVVIPLGTQNDAHFQEYLKKQKYEIDYEFPIDEESNQRYEARESFMMPSQSFEAICQQVKQSHAQLQIERPIIKKKAYKMQNCFIFEFEGQNTIEYDLDIMESIEKCKEAEPGYIVFPEQALRKSIREEKKEQSEEMDPIGQFVQGKQPKVEQMEEEQPQQRINGQRKVFVEITYKGPKSTEEALLTN